MKNKEEFEKALANDIYEIVKEIYPDAETLYEDVIIKAAGEYGLQLLRENHLIETCAVFDGRKLYAL